MSLTNIEDHHSDVVNSEEEVVDYSFPVPVSFVGGDEEKDDESESYGDEEGGAPAGPAAPKPAAKKTEDAFAGLRGSK